jgi:predicted ester cyclase
MSTETNKAVIRRWLEEGWSRGNVDVADELIDENFIVRGAGGQVVQQGREGVKDLVRAWRAGFPDGRMRLDDILAEGDMVIVRNAWVGTHTGTFYGIAPTGLSVEVTSIGFDRLADGRVVEGWGELDMLGLFQRLGAVARPQAAPA